MGKELGWRLDKKLDEGEKEGKESEVEDDFRISIVVFCTFQQSIALAAAKQIGCFHEPNLSVREP